jgi:peptidyl-tRNA hydrolase, PTH1 family
MGIRRFVAAGLGNPGSEYAKHRHNVGFMALDELASSGPGPHVWRKARERALVLEPAFEEGRVTLVKPQTFMNLSGESVAPILRRNGLQPGDLVVVHDDLDLAFGTIRLKSGGGDGGHKGVRSIAQCLGSKDFLRVRLGIGRPPEGVSAERFVLCPFSAVEAESLPELLKRASAAVRLLMSGTLEEAMRAVHSVRALPPFLQP